VTDSQPPASGRGAPEDVLITALRRGDFLARRWLQLCPLFVVVFFSINLWLHPPSRSGPTIPLGSDFSEVWAAGKFVLAGEADKPFDPTEHFEKQKQLFGEHTALFGWCYPPFFLAVAALLALLPYLPALATWQLTTSALYLAAMKTIIRQPGLLAAIGLFPAVLVNLVHGQNGFLSATLIASALALIERHKILAGILFGLMVYKPQFGLMIPVALVAGGCWSTFVAAALTVTTMVLATLVGFGAHPWLAFKNSLEWTRTVVLEQGSTGFYKLDSAFAAARLYGASVPLAYAVQILVSLIVAICLFLLWRSRTDIRLKSAALILSTLLTTPYCLDYDLVVLAPAIAFFFAYCSEKGFADYEKTALALCWIMPLFTRLTSFYLAFPIGFVSMSLAFVLIVRRAARDGAELLPRGNALIDRPV
jgi:hypothetical protein